MGKQTKRKRNSGSPRVTWDFWPSTQPNQSGKIVCQTAPGLLVLRINESISGYFTSRVTTAYSFKSWRAGGQHKFYEAKNKKRLPAMNARAAFPSILYSPSWNFVSVIQTREERIGWRGGVLGDELVMCCGCGVAQADHEASKSSTSISSVSLFIAWIFGGETQQDFCQIGTSCVTRILCCRRSVSKLCGVDICIAQKLF